MPLIFSYGSLREEHVQLSTFGRRLAGWTDQLVGFELATATVDDPEAVALSGKTKHANLAFTGHGDSRVEGMVFEITDAELANVDAYERVFAYERIEASVASGSSVWVYVSARGQATGH